MPDVEGLDELLKKLENLPLTIARKLIVRALRKGAEPIRVEAGERAPVGDDPPHLKDTMITVVSEQTATGATARIGPSKAGFYGLFQELGTSHNAKQPFLLPAFEAKKSEAIKIIADELGRGIENEAKNKAAEDGDTRPTAGVPARARLRDERGRFI